MLQAQPAPPANPLVLVPGVCGTQLAVRRDGTLGDGERCWVTLRKGADASYQKLWGKFDSSSGRVELLTPGWEVCIPKGDGDDDGLFAISVLDPDAGFAVKALQYYQPLVTFLQSQGYTPGTDLFGAGYDFRQSCRDSARALLARLQEVSRRSGGRRCDIVAHSLGGLVVRSLLADHPAEFEALVARWVAVGCPFGGAPGWVVDGLCTGVQFGGSLGDMFFVQRSTFRQAACQSPSVYELLPPLDFPFAEPPPQLTLWLKTPIPEDDPGQAATAGIIGSWRGVSHTAFFLHPAPPEAAGGAAGAKAKHAGPPKLPRLSLAPPAGRNVGEVQAAGSSNQAHQYVFQLDALPGLLTRVLKDNTVSVGGASVPLPFNPELWALGQDTHASWKSAKLPPSCSFYNMYGSGLSTPYSVAYGAWWYPVQDLEAVPHASAGFTYVDGDGTVPAESATAHGLAASGELSMAGAHRDLVGMQTVWDQLLDWLRQPEQPSPPQPAQVAGAGASSSRSLGGYTRPAADDLYEFWNPLVWQTLLQG